MVTLFLCGDVMTGRGIDQILRTPSRPQLYEPVVRSALEYVALAERAHGHIPRHVESDYVWGAALEELDARKPDARIVNLETSITTSEDASPKGINYRMHPENVGVLAAAHIDCVTLGNNHVLDWGMWGMHDTLETLEKAGIPYAGAGRTRAEAEAPAVLNVGEGRVLVFAFGASDSGVHRDWQADDTHAGVNWIADYSAATVARIASLVLPAKRPGDVVVASLHWGGNWGYEISDDHRDFAHALIDDAGVDLVWGHSSHHVKAIELYRGRAILYGCGDFLNDYEGIAETPDGFRDDLAVMYFPTLSSSGELERLELVPLLIHNFRLERASPGDRHWLLETLDRECRRFDGRIVDRGDYLSYGSAVAP